MNSQVRSYFNYLRWTISAQEAREAGIRSAEDWHLARMVIGSILLAGLLIGLALFIAVKGEPGEATWESSKAKRARTAVCSTIEQEAWIR